MFGRRFNEGNETMEDVYVEVKGGPQGRGRGVRTRFLVLLGM